MKTNIIVIFVGAAAAISLGFGMKKPSPLPKFFAQNYSEIPAGKVWLNQDSLQTESFYMCKTEVSNLEYKEFVHFVKLSGDAELLKMVEVDSVNWRSGLNFCDPYAEFYHSHPAYNNFPVVNVSYEAAMQYCAWLTKINQPTFEKSSPGIKVTYKLPDHASWKRAADANHINATYAWGGPLLTNAKGCVLANFARLGAENIHFNEQTDQYEVIKPDAKGIYPPPYINDFADVTTPVNSYSPNDFGLHNLNGNVAEMLDTPGIAVGGSWRSPGFDIRNDSYVNYEDSSPSIGFRVMAVVEWPDKSKN